MSALAKLRKALYLVCSFHSMDSCMVVEGQKFKQDEAPAGSVVSCSPTCPTISGVLETTKIHSRQLFFFCHDVTLKLCCKMLRSEAHVQILYRAL